ncbi:MAG: tyrosine-protein phosphatase [Terriglobales bacterium]
MVDIHCHILPAVDDGSDSWETSVEMCHMAASDGIRHSVATPHANNRFAYDRQKHAATLERLQQAVGATPWLSLGCDFHFSYDNVQAAIVKPGEYAIASGGYLLIEFSDFALPPFLPDALARLESAGLQTIVTHPERNMLLQREPEQVLKLAQRGCIIQVTASALTGRFGDKAQRVGRWLLERDAVHVLASDAHDLRSRPPVLSAGREAAAQICGADVARALVEDNPQAIVSNQPLPYFPEPVMKS